MATATRPARRRSAGRHVRQDLAEQDAAVAWRPSPGRPARTRARRTVSVLARARRAKMGMVMTVIASTMLRRLRPRNGHEREQQHQGREGEHDVDDRHHEALGLPPEEAGRGARACRRGSSRCTTVTKPAIRATRAPKMARAKVSRPRRRCRASASSSGRRAPGGGGAAIDPHPVDHGAGLEVGMISTTGDEVELRLDERATRRGVFGTLMRAARSRRPRRTG